MKFLRHSTVLILLLWISLTGGCERRDLLDEINTRISTLHEFTSFRFRVADNPGLTRDCLADIRHDFTPPRVVVAVPAGSDVTALVAEFEFRGSFVSTPAAPLTPLVSGDAASSVDYSTVPTLLRVSAENGDYIDYEVYVLEDLSATLAWVSPDPLIDVPGTMNVTFTRDVDPGSVDAGDFMVTNGTAEIGSISGTLVELNLYPVDDGVCSVFLQPGMVRCLYGTENITSGLATFDYDAPPVPGNGGELRITSVTDMEIALEWDPAADRDAPAALEYAVVVTDLGADAIDTVAEARALVPTGGWTPGVTTGTTNPLVEGTTYWVTVLVRDSRTSSDQHYVLYDRVTATTRVDIGLFFSFILPYDENVNMTYQEINAGQSVEVTVTGAYNYYKWYVDGIAATTSPSDTSTLLFPFTAAKWSTFSSVYPLIGPHTMACVVRSSTTGLYYTKYLTVGVGAP